MDNSLVKLPKIFKGELKEAKFKDELIEMMKGLKNLQEKRLHPRTTKLVSNIVENSPEVKKYNLDKKQIILDILTEVFSLNNDEVKFIEIQYEDLLENKLIKSIPIWIRASKFIWKFLKKVI